MDSPEAISPPNWSTIDREIPCPLCDYNLRGLIESRCPECGHQFEWADVLSAERVPEFLFDFAKRRKLRALIVTWFASLASWWFWRRITTSHRIHLVRLGVYLLLLVLATVLTLAGMVLHTSWRMHQSQLQLWEMQAAGFAAGARSYGRQFGQPPPTTQEIRAAFEARYPRPSFLAVVGDTLRGHSATRLGSFLPRQPPLISIVLVLLQWPLITAGMFAAFHLTLRRSGIAWGHVLRMLTYSFGPIVVAIPLWYALNAAFWRVPWSFSYGSWAGLLGLDKSVIWVLLIMLAWFAIGLVIAAHRYLRIPQGKLMVLLTQVVVFLIAVQVALRYSWGW